jgi:uncharacterized protein (TIGR02145 family)
MTIEKQKTHTLPAYQYDSGTGLHPYVSGEEEVWGDLFQWGRIADGHEKRQSLVQARGAMAASDIGSGSRCSSSDVNRPWYQVKKASTTWYGKFITAGATENYNWNPSSQSTADQLWRTSRFVPNDPCAHYKADGSYQEFWHEGSDQTSTGIAACTDAGTGWRTPLQEEWGAIYKGGAVSGSPAVATANTWRWYSTESGSTGLTKTRGYEIQPDNVTTTLFLPAGGDRNGGSGLFYNQGANGRYWSTSIIGTSNAYRLAFTSSSVNPAYNGSRAYGFALRCVKNS